MQEDVLDLRAAPDRAIGKGQRLDLGKAAPEITGGELVLNDQAVRRADNIDDEVVARAGENDIADGDVASESHLIALVGKDRRLTIEDGVLAVAAAEDVDIAAVAASEQIVAGAAIQDIGAEEAVQNVVSGGPAALQNLLLNLIAAPDRTIAEVDLLDLAQTAPQVVCRELPFDGHALAGGGQGHDQVVETAAASRQRDVRRRDAGAELQDIRQIRKDAGLLVENGVRAVTKVEDVGVAGIAALQGIVPGTAVQNIGAEEADQGVVAAGGLQERGLNHRPPPDRAVGKVEALDFAGTAAQVIGLELVLDGQAVRRPVQADNQIVASAVEHDVGDRNAGTELNPIAILEESVHLVIEDDVLAVAEVEDIGIASGLAAHEVVTAAGVEPVVRPKAEDRVVAGRRGLCDEKRLDSRPIQALGIRELQAFYPGERLNAEDARVGDVELVDDGQAVARRGHVDDEIVRIADPAEGDVGARDVAEDDLVELPGQDVVELVVNDVLPVALGEDIGVVLVAAGEEIVARPAVQGVFDRETEDRIVARRLGVGDNLGHDLLPIEDDAGLEGQALDPVEPLNAEHAGIGGVELIDDGDAVGGRDLDHQVVRVAVAEEGQVVEGDGRVEVDEVRLGDQDLGEVLADGVVAVSGLEDVEIAVVAAGEEVVAGAAVHHVEGLCPDVGLVARQGLGHAMGDVDPVPDHAVGEDELGDPGVLGEVVAEEPRRPALELPDDAHLVGRGVDGDDQIQPVAAERHLARGDIGESDQILVVLGQDGLDLLDDVLPEVAAEDIGIVALPAAGGLVAGVHVEDVFAVGPLDQAVAGADAALGHAQGAGHGVDRERAARGFIGRDDVGEEEAVGVLQVGLAAVVVADDHVQDRLPALEIADRRARVERRGQKDGLEDRNELAVGGRPEVVPGEVVLNAGEEAGERALHGQADGHDLEPHQHEIEQIRGGGEIDRSVGRHAVQRQGAAQVALEEAEFLAREGEDALGALGRVGERVLHLLVGRLRDDPAHGIGNGRGARALPMIADLNPEVEDGRLSGRVELQEERDVRPGLAVRGGPGREDRRGGRAQGREVDGAQVRQVRLDRLAHGGILGHGDMQVGQGAVALEVGQARDRRIDRGVAEIDRIEVVDLKDHVGDRAARAVVAGEARLGGHGVARDLARRGRGGRERDGRDARLGHGLKLAGVGQAIAVGIRPDTQVREDRVRGIDHAIGIAVVSGQLGEAGDPVAAEELAHVVDRAIGIPVQGQEGVAGEGPAHRLGKAVAVDIEAHAPVRHPARKLDLPVAVQVEDERVRAGILVILSGQGFGPLTVNLEQGIDETFRQPGVEQPNRLEKRFANKNIGSPFRNPGIDLRIGEKGLPAIRVFDEQLAGRVLGHAQGAVVGPGRVAAKGADTAGHGLLQEGDPIFRIQVAIEHDVAKGDEVGTLTAVDHGTRRDIDRQIIAVAQKDMGQFVIEFSATSEHVATTAQMDDIGVFKSHADVGIASQGNELRSHISEISDEVLCNGGSIHLIAGAFSPSRAKLDVLQGP